MVRYKVEVVVIQKRTTYLIIPIHQKKKKRDFGQKIFCQDSRMPTKARGPELS